MSRWTRAVAAGAITAVLAAGSAAAQYKKQLEVISEAGEASLGLRHAYYKGFSAENIRGVREFSWDGNIDTLRTMIENERHKGHVVQHTAGTALKVCEAGLAEPIDWEALGVTAENLIPEAVSPCSVATEVWSLVIGHHADTYTDDAPSSWADFWDVARYPGKRAVQRYGIRGLLEIALLADGVPASEVYSTLRGEGGIDRAYAKWDTLKEHLVYWSREVDAIRMLKDGRATMAAAWNGLMARGIRDLREPLQIVWNEQVVRAEHWFVMKGQPEAEIGWQLLAWALAPEQQAGQAEFRLYGPTRKGWEETADPEKVRLAPTTAENWGTHLMVDAAFWNEHGVAEQARMRAWREE